MAKNLFLLRDFPEKIWPFGHFGYHYDGIPIYDSNSKFRAFLDILRP
jgi:hypothetical protein